MKITKWFPVFFILLVTLINYPNPFNPKGGEVTTIECTPDATFEATIYLYDMGARLVWKKPFSLQGGTANRIVWNGYSDGNERVSNGVYLCRLINPTDGKASAKGKIWVINR